MEMLPFEGAVPIPTIETARLLPRPLTLGDAEQAQPLFGVWEIVRLPAEIWQLTAEDWRAWCRTGGAAEMEP